MNTVEYSNHEVKMTTKRGEESITFRLFPGAENTWIVHRAGSQNEYKLWVDEESNQVVCKCKGHRAYGHCIHAKAFAQLFSSNGQPEGNGQPVEHAGEAEDLESSADPEREREYAPSPERIPAEYVVQVHGKAFITYQGLLNLAHQRGLQHLTATFISVSSDIALAQAIATFTDGRTFTECGDATPGNVNAKVKAHFPRIALTRAKARALRDALNIGLIAVEELGE